jgi:hypothetical protein
VFGASGGAAERNRRRSLWRVGFLTVSLAFAGCNGADSGPERLADGSAPPDLAVELDGLHLRPVLTRARVIAVDALPPASLGARCAAGAGADLSTASLVVQRVDVRGTTVTFAAASGLHGCDATSGPRSAGHWCGSSFGHLVRGRLLDPRLDLAGCRGRDGEPVAFAWVVPAPAARYVSVEQPGYAEVYERAADLPVRVSTTSGVDVARARAVFRLVEHDGRGRLLRRYELEAAVAG